eukprot:7177040-Pyramimonas_sp.AAC.1
MSSAEPTDHEILSEHLSGIMSIQAKDFSCSSSSILLLLPLPPPSPLPLLLLFLQRQGEARVFQTGSRRKEKSGREFFWAICGLGGPLPICHSR